MLGVAELTRPTPQMVKLANHHFHQAQKFGAAEELEYSDDELGEDSVLLESPLDKIDPYITFKTALMSKLRACQIPVSCSYWNHH